MNAVGVFITRAVIPADSTEARSALVLCKLLLIFSQVSRAAGGTLLKERVKGPVEIVTFAGKGHGGPSRLSLPLEADWMRDQLAS